VAGAVPTIWKRHRPLRRDEHPIQISPACSGSSSTAGSHTLRWRPAWSALRAASTACASSGMGMTETSPLAAGRAAAEGVRGRDELDCAPSRAASSRACSSGIVDDAGASCRGTAPRPARIQVRGPWITGAYHREAADEKFHDGWLRTATSDTVDPKGFIRSPTAPRRHQVRRRVDLFGRARERAHGAPRRARGGGDRAAPTRVG